MSTFIHFIIYVWFWYWFGSAALFIGLALAFFVFDTLRAWIYRLRHIHITFGD